jgi:hypothetical protein
MKNLVNQYSSTSKPTPTAPTLNNAKEFPLLPNSSQRQHDHVPSGMIEQIINALTSKMEMIIEETTSRIFKALEEKIKKMEKTITAMVDLVDEDIVVNDEIVEASSDSESDKESNVERHIKAKQQQRQASVVSKLTKIDKIPATASNSTPTQLPTLTTDTTTKPPPKQKTTAKKGKRTRSPDSSLDSTTVESKDLPTSNNGN